MASQASMRSWRELRMRSLLLVGPALGLSLALFFGGKALLRDPAPTTPTTAAKAATARAASDDSLYTGSFIVAPRGNDECWRLLFDNRTGRMWGSGYVDCNTVTETNENRTRPTLGLARMRAISEMFQR